MIWIFLVFAGMAFSFFSLGKMVTMLRVLWMALAFVVSVVAVLSGVWLVRYLWMKYRRSKAELLVHDPR